MSKIVFPGLSIELFISNIAFNIGNFNIYWYAILIVSAIIIALIFMKRDDGKYGILFNQILELFIIILPVSILSARLYYVIFSLEQYKENWLQIFNFRNGGLAIYGGIIGAIIAIIIYCKKNKISIGNILDYIAPYLPLGQAIGRWGNFLNVEAYGTETNGVLRMGIAENGVYKEVHPTFLYESICNFIIFIILYKLRNKRKFKGEITALYFTMYSFVRFFIEGLRTDSLMLFEFFRVSQILSLAIFIISQTFLIYNYRKLRRKQEINVR